VVRALADVADIGSWLGAHRLRGAPQDSARLERAATLSKGGAVNLSLRALGEFAPSVSRGRLS
jgi:hypothetical protein